MKKQVTLKASNFSAAVKTWPYERFIDAFRSVYPLDQLEAVATELGLQKPEIHDFSDEVNHEDNTDEKRPKRNKR